MSWAGLLAALVVAVLLQTGVSPMFDLLLIDDLLLALALVYAFVAPVHDARLAAWSSGFACDLFTLGPLGIHAFAFGLAGLFVTQMRAAVNLRLWWVRLLIGLLAALPGQLLVTVYLRFGPGAGTGSWWQALLSAALPSAAAALVATLITAAPPLALRRRSAPRSRWGRI